ncbi:MAG: RsbS, negative regulator of sigma-B, partial [uncultured Solirubrobacteraceae bacterium]
VGRHPPPGRLPHRLHPVRPERHGDPRAARRALRADRAPALPRPRGGRRRPGGHRLLRGPRPAADRHHRQAAGRGDGDRRHPARRRRGHGPVPAQHGAAAGHARPGRGPDPPPPPDGRPWPRRTV